MNDELKPDPPPKEPSAPKESLPERVADSVESEVREMHDKLEGVVEQALPKRARMSAGRIAWIILGSLFVLLLISVGGALYYFARHSEWLAGELTTLINRSLAAHSDVRLEVKDLRGNPFRSVRIIEPRIRFLGDTGPALLSAPSMTVSYAPWDLWFGSRRAIQIVLDSPEVRVTRRADGSLRIPEWKSGQKVAGRPRELDVVFTVREGTVHMPDSVENILGWNFAGRTITGKATRVNLERMSWRDGPYATTLQNLSAEYVAADSARIQIRELRTGDLTLRGTSAWKVGPKPPRALHLEVERVRWAWLAKAFRNGTFDVPGEGSGVIDAVQDRMLHGTVRADAVWDGLQAKGGGAFTWDQGRLTVNPLDLASPAGNVQGSFFYTKARVALGGRVQHGDPAQWGPIGLHGWPKGNLEGRFEYAVTHGAREGSRLDAVLGNSELAGWRADTAWVMVDSPKATSDTFSVTMLRRGGRVDLGGRIGHGGWSGIWSAERFPLDEWPDGRASKIKGLMTSGSGTVSGGDAGLHVTGSLEGVRSEWLGIKMERWRLDQVDGLLLPKPDLTAQAQLLDVMYLGIHFDSAAVGLQLGDNNARLEHVEAVAGDTTVTVAGLARWSSGGWHVDLDQARMRSNQFDWVAEPPVTLSGDAVGVTFERFVARDSLARIEMLGRWAAPGGSYDWTGRATQLDLGRLGLPLDLQMSGRADAVLRVTGRSGDPAWTLTGTARQPGMQGHALDSLELDLAGAPSRLRVRNFVARLDGGTIDGNLAFSGTRAAWPDTLTAPGVQRWLASASDWSGEVRADSLPLERLERLMPAARGFTGRIGGRMTLAGRPARPEFTVSLEAAPMAWMTLQAERVAARASYANERLEIPEVKITRGSIVSTARFTLPVRLAMGESPEMLDRPMSGRVDLDNGDLALLPLLVPQIGEARGRLDLHADVRGTPFDPVLEGRAHISEGTMRMAGREELVEQIVAEFHFDQSRAWMDQLAARQGRKGTIGGRGWVDLPGVKAGVKRDIRYTFKLLLRNFTTAETGMYAAEFESVDSLSVTQTPGVTDRILPYVKGNISMKRAVVLYDFASQSESQQLAATAAPLAWTYDIHLTAINNLRWQPPDGDIEFSADLTLAQSEKALTIYGDLHAIRGTYDFLSNRFTVRKADLNFDNVGGVNPVIDAEATTRVVPVVPSGQDLVNASAELLPHTVTVEITGRADHPVIEFRSDPADWDQPTILSQLTVGRFIGSGGHVSLNDPLDNWLTKKINEQLSPLISNTFLRDVGQWQLEREQGGLVYGRGGVVVSFSKQFNPKLLVTYRQVLPGSVRTNNDPVLLPNAFDRNIEAEYRINRFFYVTTELAQRRLAGTTVSTSTTPDFNVNLKARWEY